MLTHTLTRMLVLVVVVILVPVLMLELPLALEVVLLLVVLVLVLVLVLRDRSSRGWPMDGAFLVEESPSPLWPDWSRRTMGGDVVHGSAHPTGLAPHTLRVVPEVDGRGPCAVSALMCHTFEAGR